MFCALTVSSLLAFTLISKCVFQRPGISSYAFCPRGVLCKGFYLCITVGCKYALLPSLRPQQLSAEPPSSILNPRRAPHSARKHFHHVSGWAFPQTAKTEFLKEQPCMLSYCGLFGLFVFKLPGGSHGFLRPGTSPQDGGSQARPPWGSAGGVFLLVPLF